MEKSERIEKIMTENHTLRILRTYARSFYDFQEVKIEFEGRLRALKEINCSLDDRKEELQAYQKNLLRAESGLLKILEPYLEAIPIYNSFFVPIRGCAVRMSACVITSILDIRRFQTVSSLWAYAGLHVIDGRAVKRKKGEMANWNQFLRAKLHVLSDCLMKLNFDPETKRPLRYRKFYEDYKCRMENRAACHLTEKEHAKSGRPAKEEMNGDGEEKKFTATWLPNGCTKGHVHNMALRYVQKMFLQDLFLAWYESEGLEPPSRPYAEAMLGYVHGEYPKPAHV